MQFVGSFADRVILDPGAVFTGAVAGGTGTNTLELASAASTGTLSGFGTEFTNFSSIVLDSFAHWELDGASPATTQFVTLAGSGDVLALGTPGSFTDAIFGFSSTDMLDLTGLAYAPGATATLVGTTLSVVSNGITDSFSLPDELAGNLFTVTQDATGGSLVEQVACYCPGTLIATAEGERPVEDLRIGDVLVTATGQHRPVKWVGNRSYAGRFLAARPALQPIRFRAGCLGGGLPRRDLLVSPEHAMFLDDVLVPAWCLVNGSTIVQERGLDRVDYVHVELDSHDVLLAEGAASESFMDDDSRGVFHNASEFAVLYPDAPSPEALGRDVFCAPRVDQGWALEAIRQRLAGDHGGSVTAGLRAA